MSKQRAADVFVDNTNDTPDDLKEVDPVGSSYAKLKWPAAYKVFHYFFFYFIISKNSSAQYS